MKRVLGRLPLAVAAFWLPTVVVVGAGIFFLTDKVPQIVDAERNRERSAYREVAFASLRSQTNAITAAQRPDGWKPEGKMAPGRWGFRKDGLSSTTVVWFEDPSGFRSVTVPPEPVADYALMFWISIPLFLLVLVAITGTAIHYFTSYLRSRDDFMAATAHDLTTPLVGMRLMIGRDDAEVRVLNERMIRLVENIKDFLRLGGRRERLKSEPVDLVKCWHEAYALFREDYRDLFDGEDLPLRIETESAVALADETRTVQVLWNLLGNDLKYAAPYGRVAAVVSRREAKVCLELVDEGPGMTARERRRAFNRYYRAKTVLVSGKGGFGIGLCTARDFARAMGGDLTVRPNSPHGCVFTLTLPRPQA